jgi:hypothetical protein
VLFRRVGATTLAIVVLVACGAVTPRLHVDTIEADIVSSTRGEFPGAQVGAARCPSGLRQHSGDTFTCTLDVDAQVAHFSVRQLNDHGKVSDPRMVEPFVLMRDVARSVVDQVRSTSLVEITATCGPGVVVLLASTRTVSCTTTFPGGLTRHARAEIGTDQQLHSVQFVEAVVSTFAIAGEISNALSAARGHIVYVECGDKELALAPGHTFRCNGANSIGAPLFPITVKITDATGKYVYSPSK